MTDHENKLTAKQTASLQQLADAKERLRVAIEYLDHKVLCTEPVVGEWTIKDLLGHIVSWNQEFRSNIAMILEGVHPGYDHQISGEGDFSSSNQEWFAQKQDWSLDRILADVENDYNQAVNLILRLTAKELRLRGVTPWKEAASLKPQEPTKLDTDSVGTLINYQWRHMNMHIRQIEKWRKRMKI
jgi:uncharacterized damage-inducible protein DinB